MAEQENTNTVAAIENPVNAGSVAIEQSRAIAEAQGQLILAKRFPRDLTKAHAELMESCKQMAMAESAFYSVPRAGGNITGPSIRLAEEIARVCGNIEYGHRELSRSNGKSEIEVYAWDKQTNTRSIRQITVMHSIDTKYGPKPCRDQRDIDDLIANKASKQLRGRILAIVPKWLVESAITECQKTLTGVNSEKTLSVRARDMVSAFGRFGVTADHIADYLGHPIDKILLDELVSLHGVYNALKDGQKASDYFGKEEAHTSTAPEAMASIAAAVAAAKKNSPPKAAQQVADVKSAPVQNTVQVPQKPKEEPANPTKAQPAAQKQAVPSANPPVAKTPEPPAASNPDPVQNEPSIDFGSESEDDLSF